MDFNALMKEAQKMQKNMEEQQSALKEKQYTASVGGGVVKTVMSGNGELTSLCIDETLLEKDNKEDLQDLIMMAVNDCVKQREKDKEESMNSLAGELHIPGLF